MNKRHIHARLSQALALSQLSSCTRRKVAALIISPDTHSVISDGYNGPPRKGPALCGGDHCERVRLQITSGTQNDIGCYHAEQNAILNAARQGSSTNGAILICTTSPCLSCARAIYHAGIKEIYVPKGSYTTKGIKYLAQYNVQTFMIDMTKALDHPKTWR